MMLPILWALVGFSGACLKVSGDQITAGDLARAAPAFSALPGNLTLALSPLPGAHRGLTGSEIQRIASQHGVKTDFHDTVCFEWPMHQLDRSEVLKAMHDALGQDGAELIDYSLFPAPPGTVVFPLPGLNRQTSGMSFWRGYVQYGADRKFNIWAKVKLDASVAPAARAEVVGGTRVSVLVHSGAAELKFEAQAITTGTTGQTVTIRNPRSGRSFAAEVIGKDAVAVQAGASQGESEK